MIIVIRAANTCTMEPLQVTVHIDVTIFGFHSYLIPYLIMDKFIIQSKNNTINAI